MLVSVVRAAGDVPGGGEAVVQAVDRQGRGSPPPNQTGQQATQTHRLMHAGDSVAAHVVLLPVVQEYAKENIEQRVERLAYLVRGAWTTTHPSPHHTIAREDHCQAASSAATLGFVGQH